MNKIEITDEHYNDLINNNVYKNEFSRFLINLFCITLGTVFGFILATVFYMIL